MGKLRFKKAPQRVAQIFKGMVFAAGGPLPGQMTEENITRWAELRGGRFTQELDHEVTHLLCTQGQVSKFVSRVKALYPNKKVKILDYMWFEHTAAGRKLKDYALYDLRAARQEKLGEERKERAGRKNIQKGIKGVNPSLYHVFRDALHFKYSIILTKEDPEGPTQKYELTLWESNAFPYLYNVTAKLWRQPRDSNPLIWRAFEISPSDVGVPFEVGIHTEVGKPFREGLVAFKEFFHLKTGIMWKDRVTLAATTSAPYFQYAPPTGGKVVGQGLRATYESCLEENARLRGLPWPLPQYDSPDPSPKEGEDVVAIAAKVLDGVLDLVLEWCASESAQVLELEAIQLAEVVTQVT